MFPSKTFLKIRTALSCPHLIATPPVSWLWATLEAAPAVLQRGWVTSLFQRDTDWKRDITSTARIAGERELAGRRCKLHSGSLWDHPLESVNQCGWREQQRIGHTPTKWFYCEFTTKPSLMWTEQRPVSGCSCGDAALIVLVRECVATKTSVHNHEGPGLAFIHLCRVCMYVYTVYKGSSWSL